MNFKHIVVVMAAVLAVLLAAGCTSSPEKATCPISPEEAANQSDDVSVPIKLTEENAVEPCVEVDGSQDEK
ncbi:MAG TPA: hypothetical protein PKY20_00930 [Methanothrix sp.]|nr:hypothetical protein [Methanothrix sp.]HQE96729.1 hypothetical protein [Methanothrix sp.]